MAKKIIDIDTNEQFDSTHELYFSWYLKELKDAGYIDIFYKSETFLLGEDYTLPFIDNRKGKKKTSTFQLLSKAVYTPDFTIEWNEKAVELFVELHDFYFNTDGSIVSQTNLPFRVIKSIGLNIISTIDVKNPYNRQGVRTLFIIKQKWMYDKHRIYVEPIDVNKLFKATFTPRRYFYTDQKKSERKITFTTRTLEEYVEIRKNMKNE